MSMREIAKNKDFDRMILEAIQGKFPFFAWKSIGGVIEKCEMQVKAFRRDYNEIEFELKAEQEENLEKVVSGDRNFNMYIPELSVSFTSELKSISPDKKVKIFIPHEFSFFERRKHERVRPSKTCYLYFEHNHQVVKTAIHDISLGGIAFIMAKSEKINIAKGTNFSFFVLEFGARKIKLTAECVSAISIDRFKLENLPYGGFKIAFRFLDIAPDDRRFLMEYVTHETILKQVKKKAD